MRSPHWVVRSMLSPAARRRARRAVDVALSGTLGSVRATRSGQGVCVTFDDGPDPVVTPALLALLAEHRASSTFFLLLTQCRERPDLVRDIVDQGHEVALHGVDHRRITTMSLREAERYLLGARRELEDLTGVPVNLYRPPYGAQSIVSFRAARRAGLTVVVWSNDAADWEDRPARDVATDGLRQLRAGSILLLHERLEPDPPRAWPVTSFDRCQMIDYVLAGCRDRGLVPSTVGSLLAAAGPRKTAWFRP